MDELRKDDEVPGEVVEEEVKIDSETETAAAAVAEAGTPGTETTEPETTEPETTVAETTEDEPEQGGESFADMLAGEENQETSEPRAGDKVTGTIVQIGEVDVFVDCGARSELPLATKELVDGDGKLTVKEGDSVTGHVRKDGTGLRLTTGVNPKVGGLAVIEQAFREKTPVEGTVKETNKGGFAVDLGGNRAFCPFSQIELYRVDDPNAFIGRKLKFRILELSENGRNIVVSRRVLLQEERDYKGRETRETLAVGDIITGTVTRLAHFGAFVDIGGLEGLVHISQISHRRIREPGEVVREGQSVDVKVLDIQNLGQGRQERISLSIKVLSDDPWPTTAAALQIGTEVVGKVTRLADFGAFVEIEAGVEGLVHISEIADYRIYHPQEILAEGEKVGVRILDVDLERRRISLSVKQAGGGQESEDE